MPLTRTPSKVRVIIADDSSLLRQRVRRELDEDPAVEVVGEAADAPSAIALVERLRPDTLLLDLRMPGGGFSVLEAVKRMPSAPAVIVLTNHGVEEYRERALNLGADGFLDKSLQFQEVVGAVRRTVPEPPAGEPGHQVPGPTGSSVDGLDDAAVLLTPDGVIAAANPRWTALGGVVRSDLGRDYADALADRCGELGTQVATTVAALRELLDGRSAELTLVLSARQGGRVEWFRITGRRVADAPPARVLLVHENITELEAMAQALRESERRFRRLAEDAQDIVYRYRLGPTPGFVYVSPASTRITGYAPEEYYADPDLASSMIHPEDQARGASGLDPGATGAPTACRWVRKDGRVIWIEQRNTLIRDERGTPVAVEGIARDVTDRMARHRATEASEQQFRALFDLAPDAHALLSPDLVVLRLNEAAEHLFGYTRQAAVGRSLAELNMLSEADLGRAHQLATTAAASVVRSAEFAVRRADGSAAQVEVRFSRVALEEQDGILLVARDITVRKRIEAQVLRLSTALEAAVNAVVIARLDGAIEWVNPAFTRLTGYTPEEVRGRTLRLLKSGVQAPTFYRELWNTITRGTHWSGRLVNRRKDGRLYTEEMTITPVRGDDGQVSHFIAIKDDVTAREAAAAAVRDSEARFRAVVESAPDGVLIADASGRVIFANGVAERLFGRSREALGTTCVQDLVPGGFPDRLPEGMPGVAERGLERDGSAGIMEALRADGTRVPVEVSFGTWELDGERFFSVMIRDVAERTRAEATVRESEERYRAAFEHTGVGVTHVDLEGRLQRANHRFAAMLGYRPEELVGRLFEEITHPDDMKQCVELYDVLRAGCRNECHMEMRYLHRDGHPVWATLTVSAVRNGVGEVEYFIAVAEDITERRGLEQQLFQAQKMEAVGRLAGGVAHDFNNLLTIIRGETELALADVAEGHAVRESLAGIQKAAERATVLTSRLLAFSRKQVVEPTTFAMHDFVQDAERMLRRLVEERIELQTAPAPDAGTVRVDRGQLDQVLLNLVVNARDAIAGEGTITVGAQAARLTSAFVETHPGAREGSYVLLTVADTGSGMTDDTRTHAFEPFYTTKPRGKGTGLGLATSFGIVKQAGGYICIESAPGRGTVVSVYLPAVSELAEAPAPTTGECVVAAGAGTVLVVEDEGAVRRIARRALEADGYQVIEAADGHEALRVLEARADEVRLLLTDVIMPGMGGREIAARVVERCPHVRVLFMSGYLDDELLRDLVEGDEVALLRKPFTREQLLRAVRHALDAVRVGG
jgi:two-component system, cell cycle sensor histidine kinase and response regulator CckA